MTSPSAASVRILLVDDHPVVRRGLAAMLATEPGFEVIAEAGDGGEAIGLHERHRPDVTVIDLRLGRIGGVDAIQAIRAAAPEARIIVLTSYAGDADLARAEAAGAAACLLKSASSDEIVAAIRAIHEGRPAAPASRPSEPSSAEGGVPRLSPRERAILERVAVGESYKEIGAALGIAEGTVKAHSARLFAKLGAPDRASAVLLAVRKGLLRP